MWKNVCYVFCNENAGVAARLYERGFSARNWHFDHSRSYVGFICTGHLQRVEGPKNE